MDSKRFLGFSCLWILVCIFLIAAVGMKFFPIVFPYHPFIFFLSLPGAKIGGLFLLIGSVLIGSILIRSTSWFQKKNTIHESNEMLKLALEVGKMGIWDYDFLTGKLTWVEGTAKNLFGRSEEQWSGTYEEVCSYVHPEDRAIIEIPGSFSMQYGGNYQVEFRVIWPDESIHWISVSGKIFFDPEHQPVRSVGVGTDITYSKQTEDALRDREEKIRSLLDANSVGIFFTDATGNIKTANDTFLDLFGYTQADVDSGRFNFDQLLMGSLSPLPNTLSDPETSGDSQTLYEKEYFRKDGQKIPVRVETAKLGKTKKDSIGFVLDLTEARKVHEEAARHRLLFQRIAETTPDLIYVYDLNQQQNVYVNQAAQSVLGYTNDELASIPKRSLASLIHPEDVERFFKSYEQFVMLQDREVLELEYRMRHVDGHYLWFRNRVIIFSRSRDGQAHQIMGLLQDITQHKQAEEARRESEERERARAKQLEVLMNAVPATVFIANDPECLWITGNWASYQLLRMEPGSNQSKTAPLGEIPTHFRFMKDGVEIQASQFPLQLSAAQGIEIREAEFDVVFDDGMTRHLYGNVTPLFNSRGNPQGAIAVFVDITERLLIEQALRLSEERFRSLVSVTAVVVWTADEKCNFVVAQPSWEFFTGQGFESYQGKDWIAMFHAEDQGRIKSQLVQAVQSQSSFQIEGRLFYAKEQHYRHVFVRAVPLLCEDGSLREWVGTIMDIHENKKIEEARLGLLVQEQRARVEAERANQMKDEFLATISHELRTPLTAIMGWLHLLRAEDSDASTVATAIETIERNAKSQAQLIEDILDVSRIVTGKLRLQMEKVECAEVIQAAVDAALPALQAKEIQLHAELDPEAGTIFADAGRLQQIVWNLLSNAIKFTPAAGDLFVSLHRVRNQIQIQIRDTGDGITPDFLPYVFDRFRQADGTITRKHGGLGLGLSIVRHLVELHGGTIHAESQGKGKGSTFTVLLPASHKIEGPQTPLLENNTTYSSTEDMVHGSLHRLDNVSILVVDDAPDILSMLATILRKEGAHVRIASNAKDAFDLLQQQPVDVLISDLAMPEEDGYSFIQRIRALPHQNQSEIPAIALTAHVRVEDRVRALEAGFQRFVTKPIEPALMISVIADLVHLRQREQKLN